MLHDRRAPGARGALLVLLLVLAPTPPASAEEAVLLVPAYRPGDAYFLSLSTLTSTGAVSRADERRSFQEDVELRYSATVVVLEADERGSPLRERHQFVRLTTQQPDASGSMFREGASFEVERDEHGRVRVFVGDQRIEPRIERVLAKLLESQFEYTLAARLLDPGRPVTIGETWELDRGIALRFLRAQGVEVQRFAGPATATLERRPHRERGSELVIQYGIPIQALRMPRMPENASASDSPARYEGEVRVPADRVASPMVYAASLAASWKGVTSHTRGTRPSSWRVERQRALSQRTLPLERIDLDRLDGGLGPSLSDLRIR